MGDRKHKHKLGALDDWVVTPKAQKSQRPIAWEDDRECETVPIFGPDYANTAKDLKSYKPYYRLYNEKRLILCNPHSGPSFPFLRLPAELRIQIYRCALRRVDSITSTEQFAIHHANGDRPRSYGRICPPDQESDPIDIQILRTCKQVYHEGRAVLYSENSLRFYGDRTSWLTVMIALPKHSFEWLKELTMTIPFPQYAERIDTKKVSRGYSVSRKDRIVDAESLRARRVQNKTFSNLLNAMVSSPRLRRLNFIIPFQWEPCRHRSREACKTSLCDAYYGSPWSCIMDEPAIWEDLEALVRYKPNLQIVLVHLASRYLFQRSERKKVQERLMRKMRYRLGVWDQRLLEVDHDFKPWDYLPSRSEENPYDLAEAFEILFAEAK